MKVSGIMKRKALFNIAASSAIIAVSMVGCSGAALNNRAGVTAGKMESMAGAQAKEAEKALARQDAGMAVQIAEAAVAASPSSPEYRTLLGRAYLMSGRFDSARASFADALTLGGTDARTVVNLSLIHVAQGRNEQARRLLTDHVADLSAADYGLAMAMAGDPDEAIRILSEAIHAPGATAKERQNLAYAYALAGRWVEARQMATVDLPPLDAARRVLGWAQTAQPGAESQRVIAMMGVAPRADDAGVPTYLALVQPAPDAPILQAEADGADSIDVKTDPLELAYAEEPQAQVELAQAEPAVHADAAQAVPAATRWPITTAAPEYVAAPSQPVRESALPVPLTAEPRPTPKPLLKVDLPKAKPASVWRPVDPSSGSKWVVQLGAFSSAESAKAGWTRYVRSNERLGLFPLVESQAVVNGRQFHRVAIAGFQNRAGAVQLCARIRSQGGDCFVREGGHEAAPSRWALANKPRLLAMR